MNASLAPEVASPPPDILDQILVESTAPSVAAVASPALWPSGAARGIQKVHYTHDAMIDNIIANPCISQNQLASIFGYSASWVSQVISSDAFQARLAERTGELVDPTIRSTVEDHFKAMVLRSLDILKDKLNKPSSDIPDNLALRTLELSSRALGYGARESITKVEVNVEAHLESLGGGLVQLLQRKRAVIDGETQVVSDAAD